MAKVAQLAFSGGVVSPGVYSRVDLPQYATSLKVARNMIPRPEGGIMKRPGLEFLSYINDHRGISQSAAIADAKLIPFVFSSTQTYMILAQRDALFFFKDGGLILCDMDAPHGTGPIAGSPTVGASPGNRPRITWNGHTYDNGDMIYWNTGGYDEIEGRWFVVVGTATNTFDLESPMPGMSAVDVSSYSSNANTIDFGTPFRLEDADGWFASPGPEPSELDWTGANDVLYIAHPDGATKVLARGANDLSWTLEDFDPAPSTVTPTNFIETDQGAGGDNYPAGTSDIQYAVTALDNTTKEESLAAELTISDVDAETLSEASEATRIDIEWDHMSGSDTYRVYKAIAGIYGLIGSVNATSGTVTFADAGRVPNLAIAPPLEVSPTFNAVDEYPGAVELFQQRIWFARTNDLLRDVYASRAGSLFSFANSTVGTDDDPIEQAIIAKSLQEVFHFVPLRDLVILTIDAIWGFDTGQEGVISPNSGLVAQSFWGSSRVKPALVGESALYVDRSGRSVRDLAYALQNDGFASSDLSIFTKHLFHDRDVVSMCYSLNPYQILFCVMSDGRALSCTYVADQQIFAWAEHDTAGVILDCASVNEDGLDNIYVIVERYSSVEDTSWRQVERMKMSEVAFAEDGIFLDSYMEVNKPTAADLDFVTSQLLVTNSPTSVDPVQLRATLVSSPPADGAFVRVAKLGGGVSSISPLLDGLTFVLEEVDDPSDYYHLKRTVNGSVALAETFDWDRFLPAYSQESGANLYGLAASSTATGLYHLYYFGGIVSYRIDHTMYDDQTVSEDGAVTLPASGSLVHAGIPYVAEFETLDLDDPTDPITGLPVQISGVSLRLGAAVQFSYGRRRDAMVSIPITQLQNEEDWDMMLGFYRGSFEGLSIPEWRPDGRLIVRSEDGFPFVVNSVVPNVEAGGMDV